MARIRRNVSSLPAGDATLDWYAQAVAAMQAKPIGDPTSWRYQAAVHEYVRAADPLAQPSDALPSPGDRTRFWTQCQHGSWFFLPWHRMYLHHFEQIVMAEVARLGGPADWALPYWNYSASAAAALLPAAFRNQTLANGARNPLYVAQRDPDANAGRAIASVGDTDLVACLQDPSFAGSTTGGGPGFGGPPTAHHHSGGTAGLLENTPHGTMHGAVGGFFGGWMSSFHTAALDPIFWLHHCNIDRLWEVWLARDPAHANPAVPAWLNAVAFEFRNASGAAVSMTPDQVVDTRPAPLDYEYDDVSDPLATPTTGSTLARATTGGRPGRGLEAVGESALAAGRGGEMAEMVGATSRAFRLERGAVEQKIVVVRPVGPAAEAFRALESAADATRPATRGAAVPPVRVFLHVENVRSASMSVPYDVYLNLPPGGEPSRFPELRAGRISMFGLVEASRADERHAGDGLRFTLEITDLYRRLAAEPGFSPGTLRVSLVPARGDGPVGAEVGRLSLYFE